MNWVEIAILLIIGWSAIKAYKKGLILSLFSLVSLILTFFLTIQLYPVGSKMINSFTNWEESLRGSVSRTLQLENQVNQSITEEMNFIDNLPLPKTLKENLAVNNNPEVYRLLKVDEFDDYVSGYIAKILINIISFIIVFIILFILLQVLVKALNIISKLPVINSVNKFLGLGFGLVLGLLRVWFLFVVLTFFSASPKVASVFNLISESNWVSFLYSNNLLLKAVIDLSKIIL